MTEISDRLNPILNGILEEKPNLDSIVNCIMEVVNALNKKISTYTNNNLTFYYNTSNLEITIVAHIKSMNYSVKLLSFSLDANEGYPVIVKSDFVSYSKRAFDEFSLHNIITDVFNNNCMRVSFRSMINFAKKE